MKEVTAEVSRVRRKVNFIVYMKCLLIGLLSAGILFALMLALRKFVNFPSWLFVIPPHLMAAIAHALARERWLTNTDAALLIDRKLRTKEIVTQALELETKGVTGAEGILKGALAVLGENRSVSYAGINLRKAAACIVMPAALIALTTLIPAQSENVVVDKGSLPVNVKDETVNNLKSLAKKIERQAQKLGNENLMKISKEVENLAKKLENHEISKRQALAKADRIKSELQQVKQGTDAKKTLLDNLNSDPATKGIADAIEAKKHKDVLTQSVQQAKDNPEKMKDQVDKAANGNSDLKSMLREGLNALNQKNPEKFGDDMKGLSEELEDFPYDKDFELSKDMDDALSKMDDFKDDLTERQSARGNSDDKADKAQEPKNCPD